MSISFGQVKILSLQPIFTYRVLLDFSLTVKAAPHECVIN